MEENVPDGSICCFCQSSDNDEALYGKFYKYQDIITHYFCLLLASKILQRGSDEDGILGFLPNDIVNEIKRGKNLVCAFCGKRGATIGCYSPKCRLYFHLPCGRKKDTFHQFFGEFKSYCPKHRLKQKINRQVVKAMSGRKSVNCVICLEPVPAIPAPNTLWAPCCSKEAWFHRLCVQRLALSAGYFFKCPLCNNTKQFVEAMRTYGIWVPEQDASWEAEPERYSSLLERHNSCDAKSCRCRQGRSFHLDNTRWEIKLCVDCGSQGMHVQCGNLRVNDDWVCPICSSVSVQKENLAQTNKGSQERRIVQTSSRRTSRRDQHVIRRISTRRYEAPGEPEDGENEEVDVVGNKNEEEDKLQRNEEQLSALQGSKLDDPAPPNPSPNVPIPKRKKSKSRPRSSKRHAKPKKPSQSSKDTVSHHEKAPPNATLTEMEKENYEIIDIDDNSDDDVQCDRTWGENVLCFRKREPPACSCNGRHSFRNYASTCNSNRRHQQQYLHHGQSFAKPCDSELITKFFSELAMYPPSKVPLKEIFCTNLIFPIARVVQVCPASCFVKGRAGVKPVLASCSKKKNSDIPDGFSLGKSLSDLAKLPSFQPVIVLNKIADEQLGRKTYVRRGRSVSEERCSSVCTSTTQRKSRRDVFLEGKKMDCQKKRRMPNQSSRVTAQKLRKRSNSRLSLRHSPVQTRSRCKSQIPETSGTMMQHIQSKHREVSSSPSNVSSHDSLSHKRRRRSSRHFCARRSPVQTRSRSRSKSGEIIEKCMEKCVQNDMIPPKNVGLCVPLPSKRKRRSSSSLSNRRLSPVLTRSRSRSNQRLCEKNNISHCEVKGVNNNNPDNAQEDQRESCFENPVLKQSDVTKYISSTSDFCNTSEKDGTCFEAFPLFCSPDDISSSDEIDNEMPSVPEGKLISAFGSILNKEYISTSDETDDEMNLTEEEILRNALSERLYPSQNIISVPPEGNSGTDESNDSSSTENLPPETSSALLQCSSSSFSHTPASTNLGHELIKQSSCLPFSKSNLSSISEGNSVPSELQCVSESVTFSVPQQISEQPLPFVNAPVESSADVEHGSESCNLPIPHSSLTQSTSFDTIPPPEGSCAPAQFSQLQPFSESVTCFIPPQISEQSKQSFSLRDITPNKFSCTPADTSMYGPLELSQNKPHSTNEPSVTSCTSSDTIPGDSSSIINELRNSFLIELRNSILIKLCNTSHSPGACGARNSLACRRSTCEPSHSLHASPDTRPSESTTIRSRLRSRSGSPGTSKSTTIRSRLRSRSGSPGTSKSSIIHPRLRGRSRSAGASETINSTASRKSVSEYPAAVWTPEIPAEPKHRQVRSVNAISMCRIKALALTARKFVPVSRVASEQRQMIMRLQELRQRQGI